MAMARLLFVFVCVFVQLVLGQFGFFPARDTRGFLNPSRIRDRITGILHLQHETPSTNPAYVYPFNPNKEYGTPVNDYNRPPYNYGRPVYESNPTNDYGSPTNDYGRPTNDYGRPTNDYGRPTNDYGSPTNDYGRPTNDYGRPTNLNRPETSNDNLKPNQDQFVALPGIPNRNGFQDQNSNQNGFTPAPSQSGFTNAGQNGFQEYISPNKETNEEEKPKENTLIVIEGNTSNNGPAFSGSSGFVFPDSNDETTKATEVTTVATEKTTKATEATTAVESTTAPANSELPPLTPVPSTDSRNNFNFGPSGIFQETCQTVENEVGSCIEVSACQPYLALIKESRSNPSALRLLRQAHCGFSGTNPKVCCPRPGFPSAPPTAPPTVPPTAPPAPPSTSAPAGRSEAPELEPQQPAVALPETPVCGFSNASFSRVVGGVPAKLGDFPWMALLGYKPRRGGEGARWLCGGSLVSSRHVLTAAHCIHSREQELYLVRLGELDIAREDEGATPVDVPIKSLVKHQEYSPTSFTNDIGILVLTRNVQFTDLIRPICIPRSSELRARSYENYNPLIAGWGDTEFRGPAATHLQVLQLPVVSNEFCAQAYAAYKAQVIDQRVLCAGYKKGGKDACQGDSGGPLMQPIWNKDTLQTYFYQIGVVSYGKKCAEAGFPGVYSRVTNFVPWIEETVANN